MQARQPRGLTGGRLIVGLIVALIALVSYFGSSVFNPVTGENQRISISPEQEIALGLQAAPEMAQQFGGLSSDQQAQAHLNQVCERLVQSSDVNQTEWRFTCSLLADQQTINAFALPGGPLFITEALLGRMETEGQLAAVMAHEISHVVARHSAEHIAKSQLLNGLSGAVVLASYDPNNPESQGTAQVAAMVSQLVNLSFGRDDELESDRLGVRFMAQAGYDPRSMLKTMEVIAAAGGDSRPPEFFSTHPNPENRLDRIEEAIQEEFPDGVPDGLTP